MLEATLNAKFKQLDPDKGGGERVGYSVNFSVGVHFATLF